MTAFVDDQLDGPVPIRFRARTGRGPVLLGAHGLGDSGRTFPELLEHRALREYAALLPDVPGFGLSPRHAPATLTLGGQARTLIDFAAARGVSSYVVLGHSMGGAISIAMATLDREHCAGVLSLEGNLTLSDCSLSAEAVTADANGTYDAWREALLPRYRDEGVKEPGKLRYLESFVLADPVSFLEASRALVQESTDSDLGRRYAALDLPTLYLHGGWSTPEETATFIREQGIRSAFFPEAGHWPHWDARTEVAETCAAFLAGLA